MRVAVDPFVRSEENVRECVHASYTHTDRRQLQQSCLRMCVCVSGFGSPRGCFTRSW